MQERQFQLGSAHEVQRFHRDVDETKDWIQEKDEALNNDDCGRDLRSVQALQRKHEGVYVDECNVPKFYAERLLKICFFFPLHIVRGEVIVYSLYIKSKTKVSGNKK